MTQRLVNLTAVKLGVSPGTSELVLYVEVPGGGPFKNKRLMTWETMRAAVQYMQANNIDSVEVWLEGLKYHLKLFDGPIEGEGNGALG